jgi:hypothetical protein
MPNNGRWHIVARLLGHVSFIWPLSGFLCFLLVRAYYLKILGTKILEVSKPFRV